MKLSTLANLTTLYNEPHRHYHNLNHVMTCLGELERYRKDTGGGKGMVEEIIWWHDAIYNPFSSENEENSARLFLDSLDPKERHWELNDAIAHIIRLTAKHTEDQDLSVLGENLSFSAGLALDIDLTSLAAPIMTFHKNSDDIRKEFHFVSGKVFAENRIKFLQVMLARKRLYYTDYFFNKYETIARDNMEEGIIRTESLLSDPFYL